MADKETREDNVRRRAAATARGTGKSEAERAVNNRMADRADEISDTPLSMTFIRNNLLHGTGVKIVLGLLIFIFAIAGAIFSSRVPQGVQNQGGGGTRNPNEVVASLGNETITRDRFDGMLGRTIMMQEQYGQKTGPLEFFNQAQSVLKNMTDNAAIYEAAVAAGISVSDADVDKDIDRQIKESIDQQKGSDPAAFRRQVEAKYPNGEAGMVAELKQNAQANREDIRHDLITKKFEEQIKADNKVTEDDYKRSVTKLGLRQIVIRSAPPGPTEKDYAKAAEANGAKAVKDAEALATKLKALSGATLATAFANAAKTQSADMATKVKGGVVGVKLPSELPVSGNVKDALQKATGNLVGPVQDDATKDIYIFLIESRSLQLPKDYAKKKADLLKTFETQSDNDALQKKEDAIKKAALPQISDPALVAYKEHTEKLYAAPEAEKAALRTDVLAKYEQGLSSAGALESSAIHYQMAQVYREAGDKKKALDELQEAAKNSTAPQLQLELARALRDDKQNKQALSKLNEVSKSLDDNPSGPSMFGSNPDDAIRLQLANEYEALGDKARGAAERKKVKPAAPGGMGGFGGMGGNSPISIAPGR